MSRIAEKISKIVKNAVRNARNKIRKLKWKKVLVIHGPYFLIGYVFDKLAWLYHESSAETELEKFVDAVNRIGEAFINPFPSLRTEDLLFGVTGSFVIWSIVWSKSKNGKKYRSGREYGSARWGTEKDIAPYIDEVFENNIILTATEFLTMSSRMKIAKLARNKHVIIIGGSGSGKTRFYLKPNLMQMHGSYVVTDPKGTVLIECGKMLAKNGYKIKIINTINFAKSMHYNPFAYIRNEKDIISLVNILVTNTGNGNKSGEDFWVNAEKLLYMALIGYIYYECVEEEQNFATLLDMINASEVREDDEDFKNPVDLMFEELEKENPKHFAVRQYKKFKLAAGKTAKSILISCGARLAAFDIEEMREMTRYDELELDRLGEEKSALFVIISDTDDTFNFIVSIMYSQMFNLLCDKALEVYDGTLPVHVRLLLDEFANIGQIPNFDKLLATMRSREISASIVLQSKSQLKALYKETADGIESNCDTILFLGGKDRETTKELTEILGKETIDLFTNSDTKGSSPSSSTNYQKTGRDLMTPDEIAVMDGGKCIMQIRGVRPFLSDKFDVTKHKQYHLLSDYDKKNAFDIAKYVKKKTKLKLKPDMEVDEVFDAGET